MSITNPRHQDDGRKDSPIRQAIEKYNGGVYNQHITGYNKYNYDNQRLSEALPEKTHKELTQHFRSVNVKVGR